MGVNVAKGFDVQPRMRLDIEWPDLLFGFGALIHSSNTAAQVAARWALDKRGLAMLSVRSGFDAVLQALALPPGSEVLVSAVTIRDMVRILEAHDLVAVPVEMDMRRLTVRVEELERRRSGRTRAVLFAHLFGSRADLSPIVEFAGRHDLLVFEDCAQSFFGDDYLGHPGADVSMFSFGIIKTATALGGALLHFRDPALRDEVRRIEAGWPVQSRASFLQRIARVAVLKGLSSPAAYGSLVRLMGTLGHRHDRLISDSARSFPGDGFLGQVRHRACGPQLALLERRLSQPVAERVRARAETAEELFAALPDFERCGDLAAAHSHWVLPILHDRADALITHLWRHGFDATRGTSSLYVVPAPEDRPDLEAAEARKAFDRLFYLPFDPSAPVALQRRLAEALRLFGSGK